MLTCGLETMHALNSASSSVEIRWSGHRALVNTSGPWKSGKHDQYSRCTVPKGGGSKHFVVGTEPAMHRETHPGSRLVRHCWAFHVIGMSYYNIGIANRPARYYLWYRPSGDSQDEERQVDTMLSALP
jgi:hypothetical protein